MFSETTGSNLLDEIRQKELKKYNSKEVFALKNELKMIDIKIEGIKELVENIGVTKEYSINFALLKAYKDRLLRINFAYHFNRFIKIQDGGFSKDSLSLDENEISKEFSMIKDDYLIHYKHLNLTDRNPPLNFYVQILTLEDCGIVLINNNFIDLKKDRIYFLKKSDISHLLKNNMVKII